MFILLRMWDAFLTYLRAYRTQHDDLDIALPGDPPSLIPKRPFIGPYVWHILRYVRRRQSDSEVEGKRRAALIWWYAFVVWLFLLPIFSCGIFASFALD